MAEALKEESEEEGSSSDSDDYNEYGKEEEEEEDGDPLKGKWESWEEGVDIKTTPIDKNALLAGLMEVWSFRNECLELDVWCSVIFYNLVKGEYSSLTQLQFKTAFAGTEPERKAEDLDKLYSDIVFSSLDSRMR